MDKCSQYMMVTSSCIKCILYEIILNYFILLYRWCKDWRHTLYWPTDRFWYKQMPSLTWRILNTDGWFGFCSSRIRRNSWIISSGIRDRNKKAARYDGRPRDCASRLQKPYRRKSSSSSYSEWSAVSTRVISCSDGKESYFESSAY